MTTYRPGDRIRLVTTGADGLPLVRYGFVGSQVDDDGPVVVLLDGELGGDVVDRRCIELVTVASVELCLHGEDLLTDPVLRDGLVAMWRAEAETAGLEVDSLQPISGGRPDGDGGWVIARLASGGLRYEVRAEHHRSQPGMVRVRAVRAAALER